MYANYLFMYLLISCQINSNSGNLFIHQLYINIVHCLFLPQVAEEVLAMSITLRPEEVQDLARQINDTIRGLTDIDTILAETRDDLDRANRLKDRARDAK